MLDDRRSERRERRQRPEPRAGLVGGVVCTHRLRAVKTRPSPGPSRPRHKTRPYAWRVNGAWRVCAAPHADPSVRPPSFLSEIGVGLTGFGILFTVLGVMMFFDKGLLAMGNVR